MPAATIATLLEGTWKKLKREYKTYLLLAIPFALILLFVWAAFGMYTGIERDTMAYRLGVEPGLLREYEMKREESKEMETQARNTILQVMTEKGVQDPEATLSAEEKIYFSHILPWSILLHVLSAIFCVWGYIAFVLLALGKKKKVRDSLKTAGSLILPMMGVFCVMAAYFLVAGGIWLLPLLLFLPQGLNFVLMILVFGLMIHIIVRIEFAHIIYVKEQKGIIRSVQQSVKSTYGYWWKIVANLMSAQLICFAVLAAGVIGLVIVGTLGSSIINSLHNQILTTATLLIGGVIAGCIFLALYVGMILYMALFRIELALTLLAHPKKK